MVCNAARTYLTVSGSTSPITYTYYIAAGQTCPPAPQLPGADADSPPRQAVPILWPCPTDRAPAPDDPAVPCPETLPAVVVSGVATWLGSASITLAAPATTGTNSNVASTSMNITLPNGPVVDVQYNWIWARTLHYDSAMNAFYGYDGQYCSAGGTYFGNNANTNLGGLYRQARRRPAALSCAALPAHQGALCCCCNSPFASCSL